MSVLFGLLRKHKFHFLQPYRDEVYSTIKSTIRQVCQCKFFLTVKVPVMKFDDTFWNFLHQVKVRNKWITT